MSLAMKMLALGALLPFAVTFVVGLLTQPRNRKTHTNPAGLQALSLALGFTGSYLALFGWPPFPAQEASQWTFYFALGAVGLGWSGSIKRWGRLLPQIAKAAFLVLAIALTLKPLWGASLGVAETLGWLIGLSTATYFLWFGLDWMIDHWDQSSTASQVMVTLPMLVLTGGTSVALMLAGSARLGQLGGMLAASAFALALLVVVRSTATLSRGANTIIVPLLSILLINGAFYADLPLVSLLILILSPLPFLFLWPMLKGLSTSHKAWLTLGGQLLFVAIALGIALANQPAPYSPY